MSPRSPLNLPSYTPKLFLCLVVPHFPYGAPIMSSAFFSITLINKFITWQCSPMLTECVRQKIIDALLTLTLITSKQLSYTQELYTTDSILFIDIWYCNSEYYHLLPGYMLRLKFGSTTTHIIWARNEVAQMHSGAFWCNFTACGSFH